MIGLSGLFIIGVKRKVVNKKVRGSGKGKKRLERARDSKRNVTERVSKAHDLYEAKKISYKEYIQLLSQRYKGRTFSEWKNYEDKLSSRPGGRVPAFVFISFMILLFLSIGVVTNFGSEDIYSVTGLIIKESNVVDVSPEIVLQGDLLTLSLDLKRAGAYRDVYIYDELEQVIGMIHLCDITICNQDVNVLYDTSNLKKGHYRLAIFDYSNLDWVVKDFYISDSVEETIVLIDELVQGLAVIHEPVSWSREIELNDDATDVQISLPRSAADIVITKKRFGIFDSPIINYDSFIREDRLDLVIRESINKIKVEYTTPGPSTNEITLDKRGSKFRKQVIIDSGIHYSDVLAYTSIPEIRDLTISDIKIYWLKDSERVLIGASFGGDVNENGFLDRVYWSVPSLSNQTYEIIIEITKAEHLDSNREFISDIYDQVSVLDDVWSEKIYNDEYVRVTFEQALDNRKDITLYARSSGESQVEVYAVDSDDLIVTFRNISVEDRYKVYLDSLPGDVSYETFDLRVKGDDVEIDYIVDPQTLITATDSKYETYTLSYACSISPYCDTVIDYGFQRQDHGCWFIFDVNELRGASINTAVLGIWQLAGQDEELIDTLYLYAHSDGDCGTNPYFTHSGISAVPLGEDLVVDLTGETGDGEYIFDVQPIIQNFADSGHNTLYLFITGNDIDGDTAYRRWYTTFDPFYMPELSVDYYDAIPPQINFTYPTPGDGETLDSDSIYVNVSSNDSNDHYTFVDFDRDLVLWMRMDDVSGTTVYDNSSYGNNGTFYGDAIQTDYGYWGKGSEFGGDSGSIVIGDDDSIEPEDGGYTIAAWAKANSFDTEDILIEKGDYDTGEFALTHGWGNWKWQSWDGGSCTWASESTDLWQFIVGTWDGFIGELYVDGISRCSFPWTNAVTNDGENLYIGSRMGSSLFWDGSIDEVFIFNRSLSLEEIQVLYNASAYQYENNFTNLEQGNYSFTGYAVEKSGNANQTEERSVTLEEGLRCGDIIYESTILTEDLRNSTGGTICPLDGLIIGADDIVLDGNGSTITGIDIGWGVYTEDVENILIKNLTVTSFLKGIYFLNTHNSSIIDNNLSLNEGGIKLEESNWNNITNNSANNNRQIGLSLFSDCDNNIIQDNTFNNHSLVGIYIFDKSDSNRLIDNEINGNVLIGIDLYSSLNNIIANNTIVNSNYGISLTSNVNPAAENNTLLNNWIIDMSSNTIWEGGDEKLNHLNYLVYNNTYGGVSWINEPFLDDLDVEGDLTFPGNVTISSNFVELNVNDLTGGINSSANITLYNTWGSFENPAVLKDGIGVCDETTDPSCYNFTSLNAEIVIFNVSSWSNYSIGERPRNIPSITLEAPINESEFTEEIYNIILEANVSDPNNDFLDVFIYGINYTSTNEFYDSLLYKREQVPSESTVNYNFTSLPVLPSSDQLMMLMHFDNDSYYEHDTNLYDTYDWTGRGNDGTWVHGVIYNATDGGNKFGYAVQFDGMSSYISVENSYDINMGNHTERTIAVWFNTENRNLATKQVIYEEGAYIRGFNIYIDNGLLYIGGYNTPTGESDWDGTWLSTSEIEPNKWHQAVLVLEESGPFVEDYEIKAYLDGVEFGRGNGSQLWEHPGNICIGANGNTIFHDGPDSAQTGHNSHFEGCIDEFALWNRSLSPKEVKSLYNLNVDKYFWKGNVSDFSGNSAESETWEFNITSLSTDARVVDSILIKDTGGLQDYEVTPRPGGRADAEIRVQVSDSDGFCEYLTVTYYICNPSDYASCSELSFSSDYYRSLSTLDSGVTCEFTNNGFSDENTPWFFEDPGFVGINPWKIFVVAENSVGSDSSSEDFSYLEVAEVSYPGLIYLGAPSWSNVVPNIWNTNVDNFYRAINYGNVPIYLGWSVSDPVCDDPGDVYACEDGLDTWDLSLHGDDDFQLDDDSLDITDDPTDVSVVNLTGIDVSFPDSTDPLVPCDTFYCNNIDAYLRTYYHIKPPGLVFGVYSNTLTYTLYAMETLGGGPGDYAVKNSDGDVVALFDIDGDVLLGGVCQEGECSSLPDGSFIIQNSGGITVAYIDSNGDLCAESGSCLGGCDASSPPDGSFIMEVSGVNVLYIDSTGYLCFEGELFENV